MTFYANMATVATNLITQFGQTMTIREPSGETFNMVTGPSGASSPVDHSVVGIVKDFPSKLVDNERILMGDKQVVLSATDTSGAAFVPEPDFQVLIAGEEWSIVGIDTKDPAGTDLVHILHVRK